MAPLEATLRAAWARLTGSQEHRRSDGLRIRIIDVSIGGRLLDRLLRYWAPIRAERRQAKRLPEQEAPRLPRGPVTTIDQPARRRPRRGMISHGVDIQHEPPGHREVKVGAGAHRSLED